MPQRWIGQRLARLRLREVPVRWNHDPASKVAVMRDSFLMMDEVRRIRREVDRGVYSEAISAARTASMVEQQRGFSHGASVR